MAIRSDIVVNWEVTPRLVTVLAPSVNVSMQDLYDTLRTLEDDPANMDDDFIVSGSGKEDLGGGVYVGLTVTLNNAQLAFEARPGPSFVQCKADGGNLVAIDLNGNIISSIYATNYTQVILTSSSSATLQQLEEIQYGSFNGGITIDVINGIDSAVYPAGTAAIPCKTLMNVNDIAQARGFKKVYVIGNITIIGVPPGILYDYEFVGNNVLSCIITISNVQFVNCLFRNCTLQGTFANGSFIEVRDSTILNLYNISMHTHDSDLGGVIELNNTIASNFYECVDGIPGSGTPEIQVNDCINLGIWRYNGGVKITNVITPNTNISINFSSGRLVVDSTDVEGSIIVRGVGSLVGTTGGTTINQDGLIDNISIAKKTLSKIVPFLFAK